MLYSGGRKTVPASRYGKALNIMETMHWTWDEYLEQPADMIEEMTIRLQKRALAERRAAKRIEHGKRST